MASLSLLEGPYWWSARPLGAHVAVGPPGLNVSAPSRPFKPPASTSAAAPPPAPARHGVLPVPAGPPPTSLSLRPLSFAATSLPDGHCRPPPLPLPTAPAVQRRPLPHRPGGGHRRRRRRPRRRPPRSAGACPLRLPLSSAATPPPLLPLPSAVTSHLYGSCRPPPPHPCLPLPSSAGHRPTARAAATAGVGAAPANGHRDLLALPLPWRTAAFRRNPGPDGQCSPAARSSLWRPPLAIPLRQELLFIGTPPSTTAAALSVPVWQPPPSLALLWRRLERSRPSRRFLLVRADRQRRRLLPLRGRLLRPAASIR